MQNMISLNLLKLLSKDYLNETNKFSMSYG